MTFHVAQLANFYMETSGGLRTAVDALRLGYAQAGHRTTLIIPGEEDTMTRDGGGTVVQVGAPVIPGSGGYRVITRRSAVREVLQELAPDRLEIHDKTTLVDAARWLHPRVPTALFSHERLDAILAHRLPRFMPSRSALRRYNKWLTRQVDVVVAASSFAVREFSNLGATNVTKVPLGVDLEVFQPAATSSDREGLIRLVYAGRMSPEKRPDLVIGAAERLADQGRKFELVMIGSGPMQEELKQSAVGLPVAFLPHTADRVALAAALARADVALLPSPAETFGLAALEAMACGTPVVVCRGRGAADLIVPDAGVAARPSAIAIAEGIVRLAELPRSRTRLAARKRAESFSWQQTIDSMLRIHQDATLVAA